MRDRALALLCTLLAYAAPGHAEDLVLMDPTAPPAAIAPSDPEPTAPADVLVLQSILVAPKRRVAVINGVAVREGDSIFGAEVVAISPNEVRLRGPGGEQSLPLWRTQSKQTTRERDGGER